MASSTIERPKLRRWRVLDPSQEGKVLFTCKTRAEAREKKAEQQTKDLRHGNKRVLTVEPHEKEITRGRDISKLEIKWKAPQIIEHLDNSTTFVNMTAKADVEQFGKLMHHCAGWTGRWESAGDGRMYFFTFLDATGKPNITAHAKRYDKLGVEEPGCTGMYDHHCLTLGWGAEYAEKDDFPSYDEWKAVQKKRYDRMYNGGFYTKSQYDRFITRTEYKYAKQQQAPNRTVTGIRPMTYNGQLVVMLSCYDYGGSAGGGNAAWVKKWYTKNIAPDQKALPIPKNLAQYINGW